MKKLLLLVCILFGCRAFIIAQQSGSCNTRTHYKFKLLKKNGLSIDTAIVNTTGVYMTLASEGGNYMKYSFIRFFNNGRVYLSCSYQLFPGNEELDNLSYGHYGYYRIDSNTLTIETHTQAAGYYYAYYEIRRNEILLKNTRPRGKFIAKGKMEEAPAVSYRFFRHELKSTTFW